MYVYMCMCLCTCMCKYGMLCAKPPGGMGNPYPGFDGEPLPPSCLNLPGLILPISPHGAGPSLSLLLRSSSDEGASSRRF